MESNLSLTGKILAKLQNGKRRSAARVSQENWKLRLIISFCEHLATLLASRRQNACADVFHFKSGLSAGTLAKAVLRSSKASMNVEPRDEKFSSAVTEQEIQQTLDLMGDLSEEFEQPEDLGAALEWEIPFYSFQRFLDAEANSVFWIYSL